MSKYLFLYRGPARPMDQFTPEESEEQMRAWGAWMQRCGAALTDAGAPFGTRDAAADLAAARRLTEDHPFLSEG
ncbi:MAG: hypothetical protein ACRDPO_06125, partial [Streptosporangiaceae bacterium]